MRPPAAFAALCALAPLLAAPTRDAAPPAPDRVAVPAGPFTMGTDAAGEADERPRHTATTGAFAIDRREVSRRDYDRCVAAGACTAPRPLDARFADPAQPIVG